MNPLKVSREILQGTQKSQILKTQSQQEENEQPDSIHLTLTLLVNGEERKTVEADYVPSSGVMTVLSNTDIMDLSKIPLGTSLEMSIESVMIVTSTGTNSTT